MRERLQLPLTKVGHEVAFNDADIVIQCRFLALCVNLLPQSSTANSGNLCDIVCAVYLTHPLPVSGFVVYVSSTGNGVFQCRFTRGLPYSSAVSKTVAALVKQTAAASVQDNVAVA